MAMETGTINRIVSNAANLQRIQPTSNFRAAEAAESQEKVPEKGT
jgi:hypothetical protein